MRRYIIIGAIVLALAWSAGCGSPGENKAENMAMEDRTGEEALGDGTPVADQIPEGTIGPQGPETADRDTEPILAFDNPSMVSGELLEQCQEYAALVESYVDDVSFEPANRQRTRELAEWLSGHYEVAGRRDEKGREYYVALRRLDAPKYEDFQSLSIGSVSISDIPGEFCQIGYGDRNWNEKILYQLPDYSAEIFGDVESPASLDRFCFIPAGLGDDRGFLDAFGESGRMELDFLRKHPGLSFVQGGQSYISCYYQDEDTIEFASEPYKCSILLTEDEAGQIDKLLDEGDGGQVFNSEEQALLWLRKQEPSIRTTGALLFLGNDRYRLLGSRESDGYVMTYRETSIDVKPCPPVYSYVSDRIKEVLGRDYTTFTEDWFDKPLKKASLDFPRVEQGEDGSSIFRTVSQTVTDSGKLKQLGRLLGTAIRGQEVISGCPYKGVLNLVREDGETLQMFVAADSCDSITYEGRIGFEYGRQEYMAEIFDEAMK